MSWLRREPDDDNDAEPVTDRSGAVTIDDNAVATGVSEVDEPGGDGVIDAADIPWPATDSVGVGADGAADPVEYTIPPMYDNDAPAVVDDDVDSAAERRQLIELVMYAWDRAKSAGVTERLADGLGKVGVDVLRPDGEAFDPARHEVGGTENTDDELKIDTIAETEVVGFADRGQVIREPVVVVYRHQGAAG